MQLLINRMKSIAFLMLVLAGVFVAPGLAGAQGPEGPPNGPVTGPPSPSRQAGPPLGVVPPVSEAGHSASLGVSGGNLSYHGGPDMQSSNTVYAIYWVPQGYTVDNNYVSLINGFFQNVAADNGKPSNVYFSDTQYYNAAGAKIVYNTVFGKSNWYVDTTPLPPNGCSDIYTSVCLSDSQIQTEVINAINAANKSNASNGSPAWTVSPNSIFFVFTAKGIGSCAGSSCAFSQYCAYHSWFTDPALGSQTVYYANMPYADTAPSACDIGQHPNNDDADATINVTSHEHNETITDQHGSAWYDRRGYEDGDKCAWNFGTAVNNTPSAFYNQKIGTGQYYLQQEWSNRSSGCVLTGT
jgi:hypothetical protein